MKITSNRFELRDFRECDRRPFVEFQSDPLLLARYGAEASVPGHAEILFERFIVWASEQPRRKYQLAAFHRSHPEQLIGCCGVRLHDGSETTADLGIGLAPKCWGQYAYALEIADALLYFAFKTLGIDEIHGTTASRNDQVGRVAHWFGGTVSGSFPAIGPGELPQTKWQLTHEQWETRRRSRRTWTAAACPN